jgi:outer membrane lipoprotein-sorting protein
MLPHRIAILGTVATVAAIIGTGPAAWAADPLAPVFAVMDRASAGFKDLTADVRKVSYLAVLKEQTVDIGTIAVKVPKRHSYRMLISFQEPNKKLVSVEGTKVEVYHPGSKTVQELDLGKSNRSQVEAFLLLGFGSNSKELQDAYTVKYGGPETVNAQKSTRIELYPKSKEVAQSFPKFELWIADENGISIQQKLYEPGGDYSLATYTNMKINQGIPDSAVRLDLPKGVQREKIQK